MKGIERGNALGAFIYTAATGSAVATPPPQAPAGPPAHLYAPTPAPRQNPLFVAGIVLVSLGFFVFIGGAVLAAAVGVGEPLVASLCGFGLLILGAIVLGLGGVAQRRPLPPPPPIRVPPTAPGSQGMTAEIACPNCGAAPRNIDRFGVATCEYCETRFLVR